MPLLDYPQYESALLTKGIFYVNNTAHISRDFFVEIVLRLRIVHYERSDYKQSCVQRV